MSFDFDDVAFAGNCRVETATVFQCDRNELIAPLFLFVFAESLDAFVGNGNQSCHYITCS